MQKSFSSLYGNNGMNLSFAEVICWLMTWAMSQESRVKASIGYKGAWNILQNTHTKIFHYCQEPLTNEYLDKFFYTPLIFQIFNKEKCMFIIFLQ